jgi:hypothetical protein
MSVAARDNSPHRVVDVHMPSPRYWQPHAVQCRGGQTLPPSPNPAQTTLPDVPAGVMECPLGVLEWTSLHIQKTSAAYPPAAHSPGRGLQQLHPQPILARFSPRRKHEIVHCTFSWGVRIRRRRFSNWTRQISYSGHLLIVQFPAVLACGLFARNQHIHHK